MASLPTLRKPLISRYDLIQLSWYMQSMQLSTVSSKGLNQVVICVDNKHRLSLLYVENDGNQTYCVTSGKHISGRLPIYRVVQQYSCWIIMLTVVTTTQTSTIFRKLLESEQGTSWCLSVQYFSPGTPHCGPCAQYVTVHLSFVVPRIVCIGRRSGETQLSW